MLRVRSVRGLFLQNVFSKHAHVRDVHWHIHVFCDDAMPSLCVQCVLSACVQATFQGVGVVSFALAVCFQGVMFFAWL